MPEVAQVEIEIDDLQAVFDGLEEQFREVDYTPLLEDQMERLEALHGQYFSGERDPTGTAWPALAPATIARKGHDKILIDKQRLRLSLVSRTSDAIREIVRGTLFHGLSFGTSVFYSIFHQEPTRLPRREHVGVSEAVVDAMTEEVADNTVEQLKG